MRDAVIVGAVRTPLGKRNGSLAGVHPVDLAAHVLRSLLDRAGIDPVQVDDVIWGCGGQVGDQALNIARSAVLAAGWPESVPGTTIDRQCGSSQQSVHFAAAGLISGQYDLVVAGGVESMSRVAMGASAEGGMPYGRTVLDRYHGAQFHQGISAQLIADKWRLSRQAMDEFALRSHELAAAAADAGRLEAEIAPLTVDGAEITTDQGIRRGGDVISLAKLRPAYDGVTDITAANSSQITDGAAAVLMTTSENASRLGLIPLVRVHTAVMAAEDPVMMLTAPIPATEKALRKAGLQVSDIDLFEVNEAFASVPLAWLAETGADAGRLNVNGGAIALGHPIGASGARLMTTLTHQMMRSGARFGLQTMCEGGGMANATIVERVGAAS
jgi:acetyl-CoA acyltransferase